MVYKWLQTPHPSYKRKGKQEESTPQTNPYPCAPLLPPTNFFVSWSYQLLHCEKKSCYCGVVLLGEPFGEIIHRASLISQACHALSKFSIPPWVLTSPLGPKCLLISSSMVAVFLCGIRYSAFLRMISLMLASTLFLMKHFFKPEPSSPYHS